MLKLAFFKRAGNYIAKYALSKLLYKYTTAVYYIYI